MCKSMIPNQDKKSIALVDSRISDAEGHLVQTTQGALLHDWRRENVDGVVGASDIIKVC